MLQQTVWRCAVLRQVARSVARRNSPRLYASFRLPRSYCDLDPVGSAYPRGSSQRGLTIDFSDRVCGLNCFPLRCCLSRECDKIQSNLHGRHCKVCGFLLLDVLSRCCCCFPQGYILENLLWREKFLVHVDVMSCRVMFGEVVGIVKLSQAPVEAELFL